MRTAFRIAAALALTVLAAAAAAGAAVPATGTAVPATGAAVPAALPGAVPGTVPGTVPGAVPAPEGLTAREVSFTGFGGVTLHGTVLAPREAAGAPRPGVVLVTGSGSGVPREHLLAEATEFARQGLATLIYDKRSQGYTLFRRSYSELADDALAAVRTLRAQPGVDPAKVGLWGLSEGGWVVPLAASRSADVAFAILVGANAMTPVRQQLWNETSALRRLGVSGSLVDRGKLEFMRLGADAGLFAEAFHDGSAVLRRVRQPVLAVWGTADLLTPPEDNPPLVSAALRAGGNTHFTFRFFPGADHAAHTSPDDGTTRGKDLAPGYAESVGTWVRDVTSGRLPDATTDADAVPLPRQPHRSVEVAPSAWWESADAHVAVFALLVLAFGWYAVVAAVRRVRGRSVPRVSRWAPVLAASGAAVALGTVGYLFHLMAGRFPAPGPVIGGRPVPWLLLQALAVTAIGAAAATAVAWRRSELPIPRAERARLALLLTGGIAVIPWAAHWGLLLP